MYNINNKKADIQNLKNDLNSLENKLNQLLPNTLNNARDAARGNPGNNFQNKLIQKAINFHPKPAMVKPKHKFTT